MLILGVSFMYHDSAAAILCDGKVVAAAAEERFSRQKHSLEFPEQSIAYCLRECGIEVNDLDFLVFYEKPLLKFERILMTHIDSFPEGFGQFREAMPLWLRWKLFIPELVRRRLGYTGRILFADHHYAHAASSFFASPFDEAAVLTADGVGEWTTLARGAGRGNRVNLTKELRYPHSLGLLYSAVTAFLGFRVNGGEGKVMGLASYGEPRFARVFQEEILDIRDDGSFRLNMDYFLFHKELVMYGPKFVSRFGPPRAPDGPITRRDEDLAASLQSVVEELCVRIARSLQRETRLKRLCVAGGVGLNSKMNRRLIADTDFKEIFIQPAAGDDGGALGAALLLYHQRLGRPRDWVMQNAYLGPECAPADIRRTLQRRRIAHEEFHDPDRLLDRAAHDLAAGRIVGWVQGRMEYGPRALGNRSILADPRASGMKDILNRKVKHREPFRPFAPAVLYEKMGEYFDLEVESPYMLLVADVRPDQRDRLPAITYVDGTARVQSVRREHNPRFHGLLSRFGELTGVPVLLNTSLNTRGQPIACDHHDALECFLNTDMDILVAGDFYITKHPGAGS
ncbi:MAG: carbamoyltransferase N-terminal domain-containing protein [Elusimicrobia bacterium]|nr:carbamoyltransferase N-terminal domain-containing protein [Elusimicrobiota bacterium]